MNILSHHGLASIRFLLANINQYEGDRDFFKGAFAIKQDSCLFAAGSAMCSDELFGAHSRTWRPLLVRDIPKNFKDPFNPVLITPCHHF
jgi:hypothetical protein